MRHSAEHAVAFELSGSASSMVASVSGIRSDVVFDYISDCCFARQDVSQPLTPAAKIESLLTCVPVRCQRSNLQSPEL